MDGCNFVWTILTSQRCHPYGLIHFYKVVVLDLKTFRWFLGRFWIVVVRGQDMCALCGLSTCPYSSDYLKRVSALHPLLIGHKNNKSMQGDYHSQFLHNVRSSYEHFQSQSECFHPHLMNIYIYRWLKGWLQLEPLIQIPWELQS